jgi:hypothetical protein
MVREGGREEGEEGREGSKIHMKTGLREGDGGLTRYHVFSLTPRFLLSFPPSLSPTG